MRAIGILFLFLLAACSPAPELRYPTAKGAYATAAGEGDRAELDWLAGFEVVEPGDLWAGPDAAYAGLRDRGTRLVGYDWMPAAYHELEADDDPLAAWLYQNRDWASLNPEGPFPHCKEMGYDWCQDYYFDYGEGQVVAKKADAVARAAADWDGVFFDWGPGVFIEEPAYEGMRRTFEERHPGRTYLEAVGAFYAALRERGPGLVASNQGFRNAAHVLPHVDLDMTESYAVGEEYLGRRLNLAGRGEVEVPDTIYYPVSEDYRTGRLSDTLEWLDWLAGLARGHAGERFLGYVYMNYAAPRFVPNGDGSYRAETPKNAILFGYAVPRLLGFFGYTEVGFDRRLERLPVYQADLGEPLGEGYERQAGVYVRFYRRGLVLVGELEGPTELVLRSPAIRAGLLYDFYDERWIPASEGRLSLRLVPEPDPVTGRAAPVGRVLVYAE